jgi:hypothetical protein
MVHKWWRRIEGSIKEKEGKKKKRKNKKKKRNRDKRSHKRRLHKSFDTTSFWCVKYIRPLKKRRDNPFFFGKSGRNYEKNVKQKQKKNETQDIGNVSHNLSKVRSIRAEEK